MPLHALRLLIAFGALAGATASEPSPRVAAPMRLEREAVVSESLLASRVGAGAIQKGGNAMDAAVATAFALAVVLPSAGNLGGGGFIVARLADGTATAFDFREKAPLDARAAMFLDGAGNYDRERHHWSALSVGVPGTVAGLHLAHRRLGRLAWREVLEPAVNLAAQGFPVSRALAESLEEVLPSLRKYPASLAQFTPEGRPLRAGDTLVQKDLARTLERIRDQGPEGFYSGETARLIVGEMRRLGGLIREEDLRTYEAVERKPLRGTYRGFEILSMPPPSSGGVALIEILNILEGHDLAAAGFRGAAEAHLLIEAMRRAFADRARYLGDADRVEVHVALLTSKEHAAALRATIHPTRASRSSPDRFEWPHESGETTHLSVVDGDLMAVSLTTTLEQSYGSRIVVPGAGFLLNNEMGDFNPQPGVTTADGLIGTAPNVVEPGKRVLSSMTPTIVVRDSRPVLVIGSPGGRTIINTVAEIIVNFVDHGMAVQDAVNAPRFHHQWLPDVVDAEPFCFSPDTLKALEAMGHRVLRSRSAQGAAMGIAVSGAPGARPGDGPGAGGGGLEAAIDPPRADAGAAER